MSKKYKLIQANSKGEKTYEKEFDSFGECAQARWQNGRNKYFAFVIVQENQEITNIYYLG